MKCSTPDNSEAKRVIQAIIQLAGGAYNGRVRLYKVFYDAHLFYWQHYAKYLTAHPIARMPNGPGIDGGPDVLREMVREGTIVAHQRPVGPFMEDLYVLARTEPVVVSEEEKEAILNAIAWVGDKTATQISAESHDRSRTWRDGRDGQHLHFVLDALSDDGLASKVHAYEAVRFDD